MKSSDYALGRIEGEIDFTAEMIRVKTGARPSRMTIGRHIAVDLFRLGMKPRSRGVDFLGMGPRYVLMGKLAGVYLYAEVDA